ncbi:aromatic ring-hydroxylating dioxygenase subunit alpha [Pigmentiphaga soli]
MRNPEENYPFDHWWVIATSEELGQGQLLPRKVLGMDVVLFRQDDGTAAALVDRCSHRGLPLSMGALEGNRITCGYHGFQFDPTGTLVAVPTQPNCPRKGSVRAFPVVDKAPYIWIWTGDPALANADDVPVYPWLREPGWAWATERIHVAANYMLLKENVLDLTHFPFAHKSTLGAIDSYANYSPPPVLGDDRVCYRNEFLNQPLSPVYNDDLGLGDRLTDRVDEGVSVSPAVHIAKVSIRIKEPRPGEKAEYAFMFHHMTTPETPRSHHYWWAMARDYAVNDKAAAYFKSIAHVAFAEDKVILEAIQKRNDEAGPGANLQEVSVVADRAGLMARRQLQALLDAEDRRRAGGTV